MPADPDSGTAAGRRSRDVSNNALIIGYGDRMYHDAMKRTTIVAPEELLERVRAVAREEETSVADIIRQALEWRVSQPGRTFHFVGAGESKDPPHDVGRRAGDLTYQPRSWR
jgi:hypothetical protein